MSKRNPGGNTSSNKILEAEEHMKKADKCLSKSLMKWSADYEGAAMEYEKAASLYKSAGELAMAKSAFIKASSAHYKNDSAYAAGKAMELAANCGRDGMEESGEAPSVVAELYVRGSGLYRENNNNDKAIDLLTKAARVMELDAELRPQCAKLYFDAMDLIRDTEREHFSLDVFKAACNYFVKNNMTDEALRSFGLLADAYVKVDQKNNLHRVVLSRVILLLNKADLVAARKTHSDAMSNVEGYLLSDESAAADKLLDAFDHGDEDELKAAFTLPAFSFIDNSVLRVAKSLTITAVSQDNNIC